PHRLHSPGDRTNAGHSLTACRFRGAGFMPTEAERIRAINAALAEWQGEQAQFWSYSAAPATLEIRLFSTRRPGNIHVVCMPCVSITGPLHWEPCALTVAADTSEEDLLIVQDQTAAVRVLCRQVYVFEN